MRLPSLLPLLALFTGEEARVATARIVLEQLSHVSQLVEEGVQLQHIGVIAPYRRQVQKIRERLGLKGWREEVMVGTVEEFQGQERRVVIVTTVRSSTEYIVTDLQHKLGFLANPKRFNVAITRARALLVVVGNPYILQQVGFRGLVGLQ